MGKVSKGTATKEEFRPVTDYNAEIDGYRIGFATFHEDVDGTPLMKGLPDDKCQCPHWGYVLKGKVTFRYADHDETYEAGDAFYTPPGHIPVSHQPDSEILLFSPAGELAKTEEAMSRNFRALQTAAG
jgi:mannose-6-phosphate isomerase-like protein (cupin superfamily)